MALKKAVLIFDPRRRAAQMAFATQRVQVLDAIGDQLWVLMTEEQAPRFAEQGIVVQFREDADWLQTPAATFDPLVAAPELAPDLRAPQPSGDETAYTIVQFTAPPDPTWIAEVTDLGGQFVQNLPVNAGVFRLTAAEAAAVAALDDVRWVGLYHPAYALSASLARTPDTGTTATLAGEVDLGLLPAGDDRNMQVRLFDDLGPADVRAAIEGTGARIVMDEQHGFILQADEATVRRVLNVPGVFAVEPFLPVSVANQRAGVIIGANQVRNVGATDFLVNLDGTGEIVGVMDSGLDTGVLPVHADLGGRVLQINNLVVPGTAVPDTLPHGTHVTGSIAGDGTGSGGRVRGMAPAVFVVFHGPIQGNFVTAWETAHNLGARVHNNSWGTIDVVTNNVYLPGVTGNIDRFCFTHPDSLIVFAAHNHEKDVQPPPGGDGALDSNRLTVQAVAKNVLTVGAVESQRNDDGFANSYRTFYCPPPAPCPAPRYAHPNWNGLAGGPAGAFTMSDSASQVALFSNRGIVNVTGALGALVATGRVKPDLVAPGTNILSLRSSQTPPGPPPPQWFDPATASSALYMLLSGTSMATPMVSGAAVLTRQYYRARFGQLRRPTLLEGVALPAAPPLPDFVDRLSVAPHADGLVMAWVPPALAADQKTIRAGRFQPNLASVDNTLVTLQIDVGNQPAPGLTQHGNATLLVHRHKDNNIHLSRYGRDLKPDPAFGTAGVVTLAPTSRPDPLRPPALLVVGDEVAVAWADGGSDNLLFQRFDATTGAARGAAVNLGGMTQASPHPYLAHNGTQYAAVWVQQAGATHRLLLRFVDASGAAVGAQPVKLVEQDHPIRDPHIVWDARHNRFVVAWCDARTKAGGELYLQFLSAAGAKSGAEVIAVPAPAANAVRRPLLGVHPHAGYTLFWEDNTQNNHFDVYLTFLDDNGQPDKRVKQDPRDPLNRRLVRISDTPDNTAGLSGLTTAAGVVAGWQSTDEINSDRRGSYAVVVTPEGAFQAQADPATPLINSGRYVSHTLLEHTQQTLRGVSMAWAGGIYFLLRGKPNGFGADLHLVRTSTDGLPDPAYGVGGGRTLRTSLSIGGVETFWTGTMLLCATADVLDNPRVYLLDATGVPRPAFGTAGMKTVNEPGMVVPAITPQLGYYTRPAFRAVLAYGILSAPAFRLRYTVLNENGASVTAPRDLGGPGRAAIADGTARHNWFHFVNSEKRGIAVWNRLVGANMVIFANRFSPEGIAEHAAHVQVTALAGESRNAVIAPRPVAVDSTQREYGVAWQYRANDTVPWEIRFSRLDRNAQPMAAPPAPPAPPPPAPPPPPPPAVPTRDVQVIFPAAPDWFADADAVEPQLVSTFTHEAWGNPAAAPAGTAFPAWSPGYGLAWIGQRAGGHRTLYFITLDENGRAPACPSRRPLPRRRLLRFRSAPLAWTFRTSSWSGMAGLFI